ncbi:hypothetical protein [Engelhardtia mirabilis]|uniref:Uncharacterized protein n=1 Tax=Engelhardtia mirabilis TaxID=2528011 RepID=A0A518BGN1_9BACT|nr:hypothetical protein Pla133_12150 [Planctomycetes bacterium Pla133]QDV00476.1 hypothetical protein Pla86_12150 [Planctomycetes bacterium Pla86]
MIRFSSLTQLAAAAVLLWSWHPSSAASVPADTAVPAGLLVNEPVVVYDVTGLVFAGSVHQHLTAYNSGFVTIAKRDDNPFGNLDVDVQTANIGSRAAKQPLVDLIVAGASSLPDQDAGAADIPLETLTLAEGKEGRPLADDQLLGRDGPLWRRGERGRRVHRDELPGLPSGPRPSWRRGGRGGGGGARRSEVSPRGSEREVACGGAAGVLPAPRGLGPLPRPYRPLPCICDRP